MFAVFCVYVQVSDKENLSWGHGEYRENLNPREYLLDLDQALVRSR